MASWRAGRVTEAELGLGAAPLWLFGAFAGARFGDNSAALFRHVVANHPEVDARWVMHAGADQWDEVAAIGPVEPHHDPRTYALARQAEVVVISHGVHDVPEAGTERVTGVKVRLGHGLTALKATAANHGRSVVGTMSQFDLVPVASPFEQGVKATWGVDTDAAVITGLCRFDDLRRLREELPREPGGKVVYLPTWREHGAGVASPFADAVQEFHRELGGLLAAHDATCVTFLHPLLPADLARLIRSTAPPQVAVLGPTEDVQPHLATCDLLVTDYSGVTWDALYLDTPVILFTFDEDQQHQTRPTHLPVEWGRPGEVVTTPAEAAASVGGFLAGTHEPMPSADRAMWRDRVLSFEDDKNCVRVTDAIFERLNDRAKRSSSTPGR